MTRRFALPFKSFVRGSRVESAGTGSVTFEGSDGIGDRLGFQERKDIRLLIAKAGDRDESVYFSDLVTKINSWGREQSRILMVTDKAIYNIKPASEYTRFQRRIGLESIAAISTSERSANEFVLHVPDEYDYRFKSVIRDRVVACIASQHRKLTQKKLTIKILKTADLRSETITKRIARRLGRLELVRRKKQLVESSQCESDRDESRDFQIEAMATSKERLCLDDFDLLKVVGRGSFGKVMLVREKSTGKIYAMKILKKSAVIARNQVEHTKSERKILQNISHPFLMALRYAFQTKEKLYFVLDYYKGGELFFHLKHRRRFSEEISRFFIAQVGLAIGHLHKYQIVYRDLKPENILMDEFGYLCLTDFGLSREFEVEDKAHTFAGTPEYLSPEVVSGCGHGKAVDWWSLGILLYELTVGIPPFYSQNVHEMYQKIQSAPLKFPPFVSDECKDLITRLLNRNPEERLGSGDCDFEDIKAHPFFRSMNWESLLLKQIAPPYVPVVNCGDSDTSNFDSQFTSEPAIDSFVPESAIPAGSHHGFDQFTYIGGQSNPLNPYIIQ